MRDGLAVKRELAGIGFDRASNDLDQRRFAGAVLANQRVDFARQQFERRISERVHAGVRLLDVARAKQE